MLKPTNISFQQDTVVDNEKVNFPESSHSQIDTEPSSDTQLTELGSPVFTRSGRQVRKPRRFSFSENDG